MSHLHVLVYINYLKGILLYASHMIFSILPDTAYLFLQDALMTLHMLRRNHRYSLLKIVPNIFYFYIRILAFSLQFQCIRFLNKSTENMLPVDTHLHILKLHYQYLIKSDFRLINHFMQSYCKHCIDMFAGSNTFFMIIYTTTCRFILSIIVIIIDLPLFLFSKTFSSTRYSTTSNLSPFCIFETIPYKVFVKTSCLPCRFKAIFIIIYIILSCFNYFIKKYIIPVGA